MEHTRFELNGSLRSDMNATEAFLASDKAITLSWGEVVEACLIAKHKQGLQEEKCIGFKVSSNQLILLFEK